MPKIFSKKTYFWFFIALLILLAAVGVVVFVRSRPSKPKNQRSDLPLETITIEPINKHSASVIFLHGLGNNAKSQKAQIEPIARNFPHIKFIFPQAPTILVSMNWGMPMPAWYNIKGNPHDFMNLKEDQKGLLKSVSQIKKIIQSEVNSGISAQKIIVIGHSQGAATALAVGLTSDYHLAGIIGLSGFLPCRNEIFSWAKAENKTTPFSLYHNYYDDIVPANIGDKSAKLLKEKGYQVEFVNEYSGGHFFRSDELQQILTTKISQLLSN